MDHQEQSNNLHGPHAFLRFVMLVFVERLNQTSDEFIFKGGNLLWVCIKTPRATLDVDFVTRSLSDNVSVPKRMASAEDNELHRAYQQGI